MNRAEAALVRANQALDAGRYDGAAAAFDEAARHEHAAGRRTNQAHATRFAASAWRLAGDPAASVSRARAAAALVEPGSPPHIAALIEEAEALAALGRTATAAGVYAQALDAGRDAGMPSGAEAELLRRRAAVLMAAGDSAKAAADLRSAATLHRELGDSESALRARVDELTYLHAGGAPEQSARLAGAARRAAEAAGDHRALGDLDLLAASRALGRRQPGRALTAARSARSHALESGDPVRYLGAALAVAELAEATGNRVGAYESLAVGLVTLADLLGRDVARAVFEPPLLAQRERWGAEGFSAAKGAYEAQRRRMLGTA